ncbi:TMV resistance protein N isoform X2 [Prunus persica]|uniref:TMV resistance protein N isoform X2 n=1 Tax=Prunus persica TaxID=3760 RepID=UPI0009AB7B2F|nr:TMV resistance protein N isoform X2 [Prunus persica]
MFFKFLFRFMGSSPLPINFGVEPQLPSDLPPTTTQPPVSSSPSSSSFTHDSSWTYDVFLSFRGEDTRTNFTDHLYKALCDKGIYTFIDRELVRGEEISPALVKAIEESRISVIVFSENYASSRWCLDELVKILQCKQSKQQVVLPIFYKVDPSHVRNQESKFGDAFEELIERKFKNDKEKVLIWREALRQAANLSGHTFKDGKYEATFINNIVDGILIQVLSSTYWNVAKYPVEIQSHVQDVKKLLDVGGNGRRMVGIWGTSGIGKTTIAKAIWNAIAHEFEGSCFLPNVRENSMPHGGLIKLQKTLLHKYLGNKLKIQSVDEGIGVIKERLRHKKILLILDDVDHLEQLENLAGDDWFGEGSRVIITTKNRGLLENHGIELIYKVKKLDYNQALELFSWHAFGRSEPPKDYLELAQRVIAFADGLPLALTILGSHLRNRSIGSWQVILDGYKGEPYTHIERILQKSYDALDDDAKEVFLDIACFFKDASKDVVLQIVPKNCIEVLVDKAMITVEWDQRILMHDLLQKLGKDIVHKESPNDPGKRSRLWFYEDVIQVLMESTGTRKIKGIMVKLPEPAEITLNPECFRNMVNLQIFINHNASLCGDINYLPNALRFIDWPNCQLQSLPSEFHPVRLAVCNMPAGRIKRLEKLKIMSNLTSMNLSGCKFLEKISDLSGIPNITNLNLSDCTNLVEIDDSVGLLDKLVRLNLDGCGRLTRFATRLRSNSLMELSLVGCRRLESFPEIEMESLFSLDMEGSGVRKFPSSISKCFNLRMLKLRRCKNLLEIPEQALPPTLTYVVIDCCPSLEKIPKVSWVSLDNRTSLEQIPGRIEIWLYNCFRLRGNDITENIFLNLVSVSHFDIRLPGDEVPKWFSCRKDGTTVRPYFFTGPGTKKYNGGCEVSFEIPPNLKWEMLRLVLCVAGTGAYAKILVNGKLVNSDEFGTELFDDSHVGFICIPLMNRESGEPPRLKQGNICQVIFGLTRLRRTPLKVSCGVHLLGHQVDVRETDGTQWLADLMAVDYDDYEHHVYYDDDDDDNVDDDDDEHDVDDDDDNDDDVDDDDDDQHQENELLSLPSASETSLGKRPRSSDFGT